MRWDLARQLYEENAAYLVKPIVYDHFFFFFFTVPHMPLSASLDKTVKGNNTGG